MTASVARLAIDDRARFDECLDTAVVTVVHDDLRAAVEALEHAIAQGLDVVRPFRELRAALAEAPTAEVAECPGRLITTRVSYWHGELCEDARCDVCGKEVTS